MDHEPRILFATVRSFPSLALVLTVDEPGSNQCKTLSISRRSLLALIRDAAAAIEAADRAEENAERVKTE